MNKTITVQLPRAVDVGQKIHLALKHENEAYRDRRILACPCHDKRKPINEYPIDVTAQDGIEVSNWVDSEGYRLTTIRCVGVAFSSLQLKFVPLSSCVASKLNKFYYNILI